MRGARSGPGDAPLGEQRAAANGTTADSLGRSPSPARRLASAAAGGLTSLLTDHGVSHEDASYYEEHINRGGTFVSVDTRRADGTAEAAQIILERCGGHSASRPKVMAS